MPEPETGTATFRWLHEGRWVSQEMKSSMWGQPYRGFGIQGYDNYKKAYVGTWCDSSSTHLLTFQGNIDQSGKLIEQFGKMDEPMLSQVGKTVKYVTRILDDDSFEFEIHDLDITGGESKVFTIKYTRVKK